MKHTPIPEISQEREKAFWSKVAIQNSDQCWFWLTGKLGAAGSFWLVYRDWLAPRIAYRLTYKIDPLDLEVCHRCDNPLCCNPTHLFLGTQKDNQLDKLSKGRQAKGETSGVSKLTEKEVKQIRTRYIPRIMGHRLIDLAKEFNVSIAQISDIINYKSWKHL